MDCPTLRRLEDLTDKESRNYKWFRELREQQESVSKSEEAILKEKGRLLEFEAEIASKAVVQEAKFDNLDKHFRAEETKFNEAHEDFKKQKDIVKQVTEAMKRWRNDLAAWNTKLNNDAENLGNLQAQAAQGQSQIYQLQCNLNHMVAQCNLRQHRIIQSEKELSQFTGTLREVPPFKVE